MSILPTYAHSDNARTDFWKAFKIKQNHMMTPEHIKTFYIKNYAVEISQGRGFTDNRIYGVTIIDTNTNKSMHDLNTCCHSISELEEVIEHLKSL